MLTPNVVAQRLGHTSFTINMQALYNNPGDFGKLKTGKYSVTLSIKVKKKNLEYIVPITMKESFEIEVLPDPHQGTIEFNFVDFLVDGANTNYSTFQLNKIKEIGLQVHARVAGYQIREGYRGRIYYRLLDLTENKWIELGSANNVYLPCEKPNDASKTRVTFNASMLKPNHAYEIHLEIERGGKREDVWNPNAKRNVFYTVGDLKTTTIDSLEADDKSPKRIFNIEGVRQTQAWENLPAGIYIVDGKKVMKK